MIRRIQLKIRVNIITYFNGTLGAMFMASSVDFITLFVGLELLSLSSYILVGIRKRAVHQMKRQ